jgi:hypothetical protein
MRLKSVPLLGGSGGPASASSLSIITMRFTGVPLLRACTKGGGSFFRRLPLSEGATEDTSELDVSLLTGRGGGVSSCTLGVDVKAAGFVGLGGGCFFEIVEAMLDVLLRGELEPTVIARCGICVAASISLARTFFIFVEPSPWLEVSARGCIFSLAW